MANTPVGAGGIVPPPVGVNEKITEHAAVTGLVVYVVPLHVPAGGHVPPTPPTLVSVVYPRLAFTVNEALAPLATFRLAGVRVPPVPAVAVTV
jgi:hypothetical protein